MTKPHLLLASALICAMALPSHASAETVVTVIGAPAAPEAVPQANPWNGNSAMPAAIPSATSNFAVDPEEVDERPLWQAIAAGDWQTFDDLVKRNKRLNPGWTPSGAMLANREAAERDIRIEKAANNPDLIIKLMETDPQGFDCAHAGNLWHLAEAYLAKNRRDDAVALYQNAATTCDADTRFAAIQKARSIVPLADVVTMIDSTGIAKSPQEDGMRTEIIKALADMNRKGGGKPDPFGQMLKALGVAIDNTTKGSELPAIATEAAQKADEKHNAKAAEMLGWLRHKHGDEDQAVDWFRKAVAWGGANSAKQGLIYALSNTTEVGREEAKKLAAANPGIVSPTLFAGDPAAEAILAAQKSKDWAQCQTLAKGKDSLDIQLIGAWCAHESGNSRQALGAFKTIALNPLAPKAKQEEATKGWLITARALKDSTNLEDIYARGLMADDEHKKLQAEIGMAQFWDAYNKTQYRQAMEIMSRMAHDGVDVPESAQLIGGWAAYQAGECGKAWTLFKKLEDAKDPEVRRKAQGGFRAVKGAYNPDSQVCGAMNDRSGIPKDNLFN